MHVCMRACFCMHACMYVHICIYIHNKSAHTLGGPKDALLRSCLVGYPGLQDAVEAAFNDGRTSMPDKSTISRARVLIDCAYTVCERKRETPALRFGLADSSPQKGFDYLLSCFDEVRATDVISIFRSVNFMIERQSLLLAGQPIDEAESIRTHQVVRRGILRRHGLPRALGSGAASAAHKAGALLMAWSAGRDRTDLEARSRDFTSSFMAFCTDMGTELGLAEFRVESHLSLLPDWFLGSEVQPDVDMDEGEEFPLLSSALEPDADVPSPDGLELDAVFACAGAEADPAPSPPEVPECPLTLCSEFILALPRPAPTPSLSRPWPLRPLAASVDKTAMGEQAGARRRARVPGALGPPQKGGGNTGGSEGGKVDGAQRGRVDCPMNPNRPSPNCFLFALAFARGGGPRGQRDEQRRGGRNSAGEVSSPRASGSSRPSGSAVAAVMHFFQMRSRSPPSCISLATCLMK